MHLFHHPILGGRDKWWQLKDDRTLLVTVAWRPSSYDDFETVLREAVADVGRHVEPEEVTWLTVAEVTAARGCLSTGDSAVERSLRMLFDAVEVAGHHFGPDRVRLVFAFV